MSATLFESHLHTPLCKHAAGLPGDYAAVARQRGLAGIVVTCHAPMPGGYSASVRMAHHEFPRYLDMIAEAAAEWYGRIEILAGLETDYAPGFESWIEKLHASAGLHYVLGSVHPFVPEYRRRFFTSTPLDYQRTYFDHLARAAETGLFDTLAHPDLIKNEFHDSWDLDAILDDARRALDRIAAAGCAMELNTSGLYKKVPEMNPGPGLLAEMNARNIPVVIGADAHRPERVGDRFTEAIALLEQAGYRHVSVFRARRRSDIPIAEARASLRSPSEN